MNWFSSKEDKKNEFQDPIEAIGIYYWQVFNQKDNLHLEIAFNNLKSLHTEYDNSATRTLMTSAAIEAAYKKVPAAVQYIGEMKLEGVDAALLNRVPDLLYALVSTTQGDLLKDVVTSYTKHMHTIEADEKSLYQYAESMKKVADQKQNNQDFALRHMGIDGLTGVKNVKNLKGKELGFFFEALLPSLTDNAAPDGQKSAASKVAQEMVSMLSDESSQLSGLHPSLEGKVSLVLKDIKLPHILTTLAEVPGLQKDALDQVVTRSTETVQSFMNTLATCETFFKTQETSRSYGLLLDLYNSNIADFLEKNEALRGEIVSADLRINAHFEENQKDVIKSKKPETIEKEKLSKPDIVKKATTNIKNDPV